MKIKIPLYIIVSVFLAAGCRQSRERPDEERFSGDKARQQLTYDPIGLPQDKENIPMKYPLPGLPETPADTPGTAPTPIAAKGDSSSLPYETYRLQLFTSNTYGPAARELNIAREIFDRVVHFDYEVPYYKIRVGDFATREEAERYVPIAKEAGYDNAWVVRVSVNIRTLEDMYQDDIPPLIDSSDTNVILPESTDAVPENPED